jgi:hypothetical protein
MQMTRATYRQGSRDATIAAPRRTPVASCETSTEAVARVVRRVLRSGSATNAFERFVLFVARALGQEGADPRRVEADVTARVLRRLGETGLTAQ